MIQSYKVCVWKANTLKPFYKDHLMETNCFYTTSGRNKTDSLCQLRLREEIKWVYAHTWLTSWVVCICMRQGIPYTYYYNVVTCLARKIKLHIVKWFCIPLEYMYTFVLIHFLWHWHKFVDENNVESALHVHRWHTIEKSWCVYNRILMVHVQFYILYVLLKNGTRNSH